MSDLPPAVASWRDQIERLSEHASPCRYLAPAKWAAIRANALAFIDQHGAEAHRLGLTAPELFGVHPMTGTLRVDSCGVLMLGPGAAETISADRIGFGQMAGYRFTKGQTPGIPVWEFAARARAG
ncbi:hypothetical protein ACLBX9_28790 [Methylobacterium sp. A49B]